MSTGPVFGLDTPNVGIEADFLRQPLFHRWLRHRLFRHRRENTLERPAVVVGGLRRRGVEHGVAVEQRHLDENGASLLGAAAAHGAKDTFGLAAAQIGGYPDT